MASSDASSGRWRGISLVLGLVAIGLGLWLIIRPIASLSTLGLAIAAGLLATGGSRLTASDTSFSARLLAVLWVAVAFVLVVWPDLTMRWLVLLVGAHLAIDGIGDIWAGVRSEADQRFAAIVRGVATVIFGVLALTWPDVTLLVIAIAFAARLIIFGVSHALTAIRGRVADERGDRPGRLRRWLEVVGAVATLAVAGLLAIISSWLNDGRPMVDGFYAAPAEAPEAPGQLIRIEPFERGIPDDAVAWRILYTTTRDEGQPALASAIVVAPSDEADGPREVIAWAHGTTGVHETCAPSVLEGTFSTGAFFSVEEVVDEGWVLVATDYVGLGTEGPHPYLIGQGEARSVLDSVRAARQMEEIDMADRTVVWGHSQGGHAALWTAAIASTYAPEVDVIGVAALAPASDVVGLIDSLPSVTGGSIFAAYAVSAYSAVYDDVRFADYVVPSGRVNVERIARRCLAEPSVLTSVLSAVALNFSVFQGDLTSGALSERLTENIPPQEIEVPLFLAQGEADSLIALDTQDAFVAGLCESGSRVDYRIYTELDHVPLVEADSPLIPELFDWTSARLTDQEPVSIC
ncbi:MAG TPA: lipase family protein [Acidimicrobiia bacterium]|jgi:uncharacterized membrane protein HdeD (DUF308 family)/acetyl esterase/lipase